MLYPDPLSSLIVGVAASTCPHLALCRGLPSGPWRGLCEEPQVLRVYVPGQPFENGVQWEWEKASALLPLKGNLHS